MRGTALALVQAIFAAQGFGKHAIQVNALGNLIVDATIGGDHIITRGGELGNRGGNAFLPGHRPVGESELAGGKPGLNGLVHRADAGHLPIDRLQRFGFDPEITLSHHHTPIFQMPCICPPGGAK